MTVLIQSLILAIVASGVGPAGPDDAAAAPGTHRVVSIGPAHQGDSEHPPGQVYHEGVITEQEDGEEETQPEKALVELSCADSQVTARWAGRQAHSSTSVLSACLRARLTVAIRC